MLETVVRVARTGFVLGAAVVGALSTWLFGSFAADPYFPTIPGWARYPEPWPTTWRTLVGNLVLAGVLGALVVILVRQSGNLRLPSPVRAALRVLVFSGAAYVLVAGWQLTARDAIGTEQFAVGPVTWPSVIALVGAALVCTGVSVGAVDVGVRTELRTLLGHQANPPPAAQVRVGRWIVAAGVMAWMWVTPWRTMDRLELSVLATVAVAVWLVRGSVSASGEVRARR
jgi:hypothetical protein